MATMENLKAAHDKLRDETARAGQSLPADKAQAGRQEVEALRAEIDACGNDQVKIDAVYGKVEAARAKLTNPAVAPAAPPSALAQPPAVKDKGDKADKHPHAQRATYPAMGPASSTPVPPATVRPFPANPLQGPNGPAVPPVNPPAA